VERAQRLEFGQSAGVRENVACYGNRNIVAAKLPLGSDVSRDPPDRGMIEQQSLGNALHDVYQIIVPADMCQFMREHSRQTRLIGKHIH